MYTLELGLIGLGLVLAVYGALALLGTLLFPRLLESPLFGKRMFLGRIPPTKRNRILMSVWFLAFGLHVSLSTAEISPWRYVALGVVLVLCTPVVRLHLRSRR